MRYRQSSVYKSPGDTTEISGVMLDCHNSFNNVNVIIYTVAFLIPVSMEMADALNIDINCKHGFQSILRFT